MEFKPVLHDYLVCHAYVCIDQNKGDPQCSPLRPNWLANCLGNQNNKTTCWRRRLLSQWECRISRHNKNHMLPKGDTMLTKHNLFLYPGTISRKQNFTFRISSGVDRRRHRVPTDAQDAEQPGRLLLLETHPRPASDASHAAVWRARSLPFRWVVTSKDCSGRKPLLCCETQLYSMTSFDSRDMLPSCLLDWSVACWYNPYWGRAFDASFLGVFDPSLCVDMTMCQRSN